MPTPDSRLSADSRLATRILYSLRFHAPQEPGYLDRSPDVGAFSYLLDAVVRFDLKCDGVLADFSHFGSRSHGGSDRRRCQVPHVDYCANGDPAFRQVGL